MRRFILIVLFLLPLAVFAVSLSLVNDCFDAGKAAKGILIFLGALAVLVAVEYPLLRYWVLPHWAQNLGERLYAGNYSPPEDKVVAAAEQIRREGDEKLLAQLEALVQADPSRLRGWRELADVQLHVFHRPGDAVATLLKAEGRVPGGEDRALLLYRAAQWTENRLNDPSRARELYARAAKKYPATVYGRRAGMR